MAFKQNRRLMILCSLFCVCNTLTELIQKQSDEIHKDKLLLLVLTPSEEVTREFHRFGSQQHYGIPFKILSRHNCVSSLEFESEIQLLEMELKINQLDDSGNVIIVSKSFDLIFNDEPNEILERFYQSGARVIFSFDKFISQYPLKNDDGKNLLKSDLFIGYAADLYQLLKKGIEIPSNQSTKLDFKVDYSSELFQHVSNDSLNDLDIVFNGKMSYLRNAVSNTVPAIIMTNLQTRSYLSYTMKNYDPGHWNPIDGCLLSCRKNVISLQEKMIKDLPTVLIGVFIEQATPFLDEFLEKLYELAYPKEMLHLVIHNAVEYHNDLIIDFVEKHGKKYSSLKIFSVEDKLLEWQAKNLTIEECLKNKCDYYFNVDAIVHIDNPYTLLLLIEQNRPVLSPMMIHPYTTHSNFWGSVFSDGRYARSIDYNEIIQNKRRGVWSVPRIVSCYLVRKDVLPKDVTNPLYTEDTDGFSSKMLADGVDLMVTNRLDWGHLIKADNFETSHLNNELYQIINNRWDWEKRYLHENYTHALNLGSTIAMPCPDDFWFPIVTERFADEIVAEMENYGKWAGVNVAFSPRLINMEGIGFDQQWDHFLTQYVQPLQQRTFEGYWKPPEANLKFVIRYRLDEMPELKPHHDVSTYTINIALNHVGIDYEGGGCRFLRYNCTLSATRKGWMMLHPGRFSHYHQGLPITSGTRYILVTFIDP